MSSRIFMLNVVLACVTGNDYYNDPEMIQLLTFVVGDRWKTEVTASKNACCEELCNQYPWLNNFRNVKIFSVKNDQTPEANDIAWTIMVRQIAQMYNRGWEFITINKNIISKRQTLESIEIPDQMSNFCTQLF